MKNSIVLIALLILGIGNGFAQKAESILFIIESLDSKEYQEIRYPLGTTFKTEVLNKLKETKKRKGRIIYTGDIDLTIYPSYSKEMPEVKKIRNERLTIQYYDLEESTVVVGTDSLTEKSTEEETASNTAKAPTSYPEIIIYPNPSTTEINVNLGELEDVTVQLVNTKGTVIYEIQTKNRAETVITFDISELTPGIYFIRTRQADTGFITKKVIIGSN